MKRFLIVPIIMFGLSAVTLSNSLAQGTSELGKASGGTGGTGGAGGLGKLGKGGEGAIEMKGGKGKTGEKAKATGKGKSQGKGKGKTPPR